MRVEASSLDLLSGGGVNAWEGKGEGICTQDELLNSMNILPNLRTLHMCVAGLSNNLDVALCCCNNSKCRAQHQKQVSVTGGD